MLSLRNLMLFHHIIVSNSPLMILLLRISHEHILERTSCDFFINHAKKRTKVHVRRSHPYAVKKITTFVENDYREESVCLPSA